MSCEHCEANERVKVALQEQSYRLDKARVEAEDRARAAEARQPPNLTVWTMQGGRSVLCVGAPNGHVTTIEDLRVEGDSPERYAQRLHEFANRIVEWARESRAG